MVTETDSKLGDLGVAADLLVPFTCAAGPAQGDPDARVEVDAAAIGVDEGIDDPTPGEEEEAADEEFDGATEDGDPVDLMMAWGFCGSFAVAAGVREDEADDGGVGLGALIEVEFGMDELVMSGAQTKTLEESGGNAAVDWTDKEEVTDEEDVPEADKRADGGVD